MAKSHKEKLLDDLTWAAGNPVRAKELYLKALEYIRAEFATSSMLYYSQTGPALWKEIVATRKELKDDD